MIVPDKITPEIGWRVWRPWIDGTITGPCELKGNGWRPQREAVASCNYDKTHTQPQQSCSCGLHAAKTLELLEANFLLQIMAGYGVVGEVALWGTVIEGEWGYRAEFAYPASFYVPDELLVNSGLETPGYISHSAIATSLREFGVPVVRVPTIYDIPTNERIAA